MRKRLLTAVLIVGVAFCGATPVVANENTFFGTGIGAALGGLLGSQFGHGDARLAYTGLGVFTGGVIGNSIGTSMDRADTAYYSGPSYGYEPAYVGTAYYEPTYVAPPAPPPPRMVYVQPQTIEYRTVGPAYVSGGYMDGDYAERSSQISSSSYCREFTQQVRIDGRLQESYGTACLQSDGSWKIER